MGRKDVVYREIHKCIDYSRSSPRLQSCAGKCMNPDPPANINIYRHIGIDFRRGIIPTTERPCRTGLHKIEQLRVKKLYIVRYAINCAEFFKLSCEREETIRNIPGLHFIYINSFLFVLPQSFFNQFCFDKFDIVCTHTNVYLLFYFSNKRLNK